MAGSGNSPAPESSVVNEKKASEDDSPPPPPSPPPATSPASQPPTSTPKSPPPSPPSPSPPKTSPPPDESPTPPPKESPSPPPPSSPPPSSPPRSSPPPSSPPPSPSSPPKSNTKAPPPPPSPSPPKASSPGPPSDSSPPKDNSPPSSDGGNNNAQPPPPSDQGDQGTPKTPVSPPPPGTPAVPAQPTPNPATPAVPTAPKQPAPKTPLPPTPPPPKQPAAANKTADDSSNNSSHTGTVVGLTVAVIFLFALVAVVFLFVRRRKKKTQPYPPNYMAAPPGAALTPEGYYQGPNSGQAESYYSNGPYAQTSQTSQTYGAEGQRERNGGGSDSDLNIGGHKAHFTYEELMEITNGFSRQNVLGEGGFGCVYKGWMQDGKVVAVKQLKAGSGQGEREFRAEVDIISRVHHRHLVSLVGYCISEQQRLLIYEYVPNQTLEHHLHGAGMPLLDWTKRLKIALGSAKGLAYLHEDCHPKIIHRDIKSANILLDDSFEAQACYHFVAVADFGLAKLTDDMNTHVSTRVMGTFGYMAPEYASSGKLTDRSDVFSFGVVLLELVTGRKPVDATRPLGDESLVEWARPLLIKALESGDLSELVDPRLEKHYVEGQMLRMVEAAAACVRHSATKRPRMAQVCRALDCEGDDLSNGVKFGQSTAYDSGQYNEDIMRFRRMALGSGSSEFEVSSAEFAAGSKELSGPQNSWTTTRPDMSSDESETRAFNNKGSASRNQRTTSVRGF
ncbi:hypothetical protein ACLB2K_036260 [Fragaria x ananassa]